MVNCPARKVLWDQRKVRLTPFQTTDLTSPVLYYEVSVLLQRDKKVPLQEASRIPFRLVNVLLLGDFALAYIFGSSPRRMTTSVIQNLSNILYESSWAARSEFVPSAVCATPYPFLFTMSKLARARVFLSFGPADPRGPLCAFQTCYTPLPITGFTRS
jgi:hypothetical protein